jgi:hypothetical protein
VDGQVINKLLSKETTCQLCRKTVWIFSLTTAASFKTECGRADCPINADCTAHGQEASEAALFAYQVSFLYPDNQ